jgi:hypothetical protein
LDGLLFSQRRRKSREYLCIDLLRYLWMAVPTEREILRGYAEKAKSYRNDCGCAVGGFFVAAAMATIIVYGFVFSKFELNHWFMDAIQAIVCLVGAAFVGKLAGIGYARFRLVLLGRRLRLRYLNRNNYVDLQ